MYIAIGAAYEIILWKSKRENTNSYFVPAYQNYVLQSRNKHYFFFYHPSCNLKCFQVDRFKFNTVFTQKGSTVFLRVVLSRLKVQAVAELITVTSQLSMLGTVRSSEYFLQSFLILLFFLFPYYFIVQSQQQQYRFLFAVMLQAHWK